MTAPTDRHGLPLRPRFRHGNQDRFLTRDGHALDAGRAELAAPAVPAAALAAEAGGAAGRGLHDAVVARREPVNR
jgi:hypothetical protein